MTRPNVIVICGPTGSGKTSLSIELARSFDGEIICADSMQVYKLMDIGTAKATGEEQAAVPHHMIDLVYPDQHYDAALYAETARRLIHALHRRNKVAFVVGGTGFYIKALIHGLFKMERNDGRIRNRLKKEADADGSARLHDRLNQIDPAAARRIHPNDLFRIIRALEVYELTGKHIERHHQNHLFSDSPFHVLTIGLSLDRERLYERINQRADAMIENGFVQEVGRLLDLKYAPHLKPMQSIGYRHLIDFLINKRPMDETVALLKRDTRRYAKRQLTWFRADATINWINPAQIREMGKKISDFLHS